MNPVVIVQVRSSVDGSQPIRDLRGMVERNEAAIGVLVTSNPPTKPMMEEAASAGSFHSDEQGRDYPKIQILSAQDLLSGKKMSLPPGMKIIEV
jgi:site-specific DNA-methyltransferase (adenine-specific)